MRKLALVSLVLATPAFAQDREPWQPPTLTTTRYDEDWSTMADPADRPGRWSDNLKYIPIADDAYATVAAELRVRNESYRNNLWGGAAAPNDGYQWVRFVPSVDLHVGRVRAFIQPIAAYAIGVAPSPSPIDQTRVDMLQAFTDVRIGEAGTNSPDGYGVTLRAGRQMISLGTERLVGTRYGPNTPLAFDGFRALASLDGATLSVFAVRPVQPGPSSFDDRRSRTKMLWGVYLTRHGLDLYYLGFHNDQARFGGVVGDEVRHSVGARVFGSKNGWHWNAEGIYQFGHFTDQTISAWTMGTEFGHKFPTAPGAPDATLRFNIVSGDRHAGDKSLNTFNAMFPKGKYFGELSPIGPYNIVSLNPRVAFTVAKNVSASLAGMAYWRFSKADGIYDIPGNLIRAPGSANSRFIGKEVEGTLAWQATPDLELSTSLSLFSSGSFIRQTGPSRTIGMLGLEANFRF
ncbi:alginate export family protein [Sphingomonas abietis]|uniref:Alginate export family protein n=1 Tax=Sphingomonas abietis TaxID=3012344 RepID=A0ABY7NMF6_9SPHN|nr:alginate export family protein [Sphingomonas abietis]WBO21823.1 alginate export family protein [Sphingomonas abietis]